MPHRAIKNLAQLSDKEFFQEVSYGMQAVRDNAKELASDAEMLFTAKRHRASELLLSVAAEESAKYLVLMDAVRCAKPRRAKHLKCFNDHTAKGIYVRYAATAPASFGEVCEFVEEHRQSHFLDGPTGYDYILRNSIAERREGLFYVDYVKDDDGCRWSLPSWTEGDFGFPTPVVLDLAETMARAGMDSPEALRIIAAVWEGVTFERSDGWGRCHGLNWQALDKLNEAGLLTAEGQKQSGHIAWQVLLFPLCDLELCGQKEIDLNDLRTKRDAVGSA